MKTDRAIEAVCYWLAASAMMVAGVLFSQMGIRWLEMGGDLIMSGFAVACGALGGVLGVLGYFAYDEARR